MMGVTGKLAMMALAIQNTIVVISMRYSRTRGSAVYMVSTAVALAEVLKLLICLGVVYAQSPSITKFVQRLDSEVKNNPKEILKLTVPGLVYMFQNNLLYIALTHLDAATYSVLYQLRILTTALFSVVMLGRRLSGLKWLALAVLTFGVAIVEVSSVEPSKKLETINNNALGFMAIMAAAGTSGFAGVYFEAVLKGARISLFIRNIQMGVSSVVFAFLYSYIKDGSQISTLGYFFGYDFYAFLVIFAQAIGGIMVAVVVKYTDNILKTFATTVSILMSTLLSMVVFGSRPRAFFVLGAILVILSIFMYGKKTTTANSSNGQSSKLDVSRLPHRDRNFNSNSDGFQTVDDGGNISLGAVDTKLPV